MRQGLIPNTACYGPFEIRRSPRCAGEVMDTGGRSGAAYCTGLTLPPGISSNPEITQERMKPGFSRFRSVSRPNAANIISNGIIGTE
jgi:hypothetical protein